MFRAHAVTSDPCRWTSTANAPRPGSSRTGLQELPVRLPGLASDQPCQSVQNAIRGSAGHASISSGVLLRKSGCSLLAPTSPDFSGIAGGPGKGKAGRGPDSGTNVTLGGVADPAKPRPPSPSADAPPGGRPSAKRARRRPVVRETDQQPAVTPIETLASRCRRASAVSRRTRLLLNDRVLAASPARMSHGRRKDGSSRASRAEWPRQILADPHNGRASTHGIVAGIGGPEQLFDVRPGRTHGGKEQVVLAAELLVQDCLEMLAVPATRVVAVCPRGGTLAGDAEYLLIGNRLGSCHIGFVGASVAA